MASSWVGGGGYEEHLSLPRYVENLPLLGYEGALLSLLGCEGALLPLLGYEETFLPLLRYEETFFP
jgi:hypothetical protein